MTVEQEPEDASTPSSPDPSPSVVRRTTLARSSVVLLTSASAVLVIIGIRSASGIVGPAFLALMLVIAVHPILDYTRRRGWPGWVGTLLGLVAVYVILIVMALTVVASIAKFATLIPQYSDDWNRLVGHATSKLDHAGVGSDQQQTVAGAFDPQQLEHFVLGLLDDLASFTSALAFLVTVLLFFALDASSFPKRLAETKAPHLNFVTALSGFASGTRRYLVVSTVFGFIVAVIDTIALSLLGVPGAVAWGLLAFITNYIPNIGFVIGLVPPAILALLEGGPALMIWVIAIYCVVNFVIQTVIQPRVVGDAVGLTASMTFLSLVFWAWVLGPLGALLAVPATLLLKALLIDADPETRWLLPMLSGTPEAQLAEGPPADK